MPAEGSFITLQISQTDNTIDKSNRLPTCWDVSNLSSNKYCIPKTIACPFCNIQVETRLHLIMREGNQRTVIPHRLKLGGPEYREIWSISSNHLNWTTPMQRRFGPKTTTLVQEGKGMVPIRDRCMWS